MHGAYLCPRGLMTTAVRVALAWFLLLAQAWAGGPRFVSGPPFFTGPAGVPVGWRQTQLTYATDSGDLSGYVNHAAADAMVAAAAGVWNLPVANINIAQAGQLAEDVNGANSYLGPGGLVFPADVMSANAAAVPIAVVYDSDGAITDLLLGSGASLPAECAQNGVTESVDAFDPAGYILHAIVVVNGRCTGSAPQAQLQLQYQLMRVFGRVLGLAWSQTNDNVFTGATTVTYAQELNWPIMHPIDIICGSYSYQCLVNPFQLRPDDIAAMVTVYPVTQAAVGKQISLANATGLDGLVTFPSGGGMAGVNVLVKRQSALAVTTDAAYEASAVSGTLFRRAGTSPFVAVATDAPASMGTFDQNDGGRYGLEYVPMLPGQTGETLLLTVEPVNPLYIGEHSVGPYAPGMVSLSGTAPTIAPQFGVDEGGLGWLVINVPTAPALCGSGTDGTPGSPMAMPSTGWWNGLLCGYGHASYVGAEVKPGRSFTVEAIALNEQGLATTAKAMPVIGVFAPTDQPGDLPTVAVQATAFQGWTTGTTSLHAATGTMTGVRIGIADERGDGRPDFAYQARMFYADSITPAIVGTAGATVTITGVGFRNGNAVAINGVPVTVMSWSANAIVVKAPAMSVVKATANSGVDVQVSDRTTGAITVMTAALTYQSMAGLPNAMRLLSVQTGAMYVGDTAAIPFAVQVVEADGVTPVAGETVVFSATTGSAQFGCGAATCSVVTDAQGMAQTSVAPTATGIVTLQAADGALMQSGSFTVLPQAGAILVLVQPTGALNVGVQAGAPIAVEVVDANGNPMGNVPVTFSVISGQATFSKCANPTCVVMSDGGGGSGTWLTPGSIGPITIRASVGDVGVNDTFTGVSSVDTMQVISTPAQPAYPYTPAESFAVRLVTPQGNADSYQAVTFTAPPGVKFAACGSNTCIGTTDWNGWVGFQIMGTAAGTYPLTAAFGLVTQTQVFTVTDHTLTLNVISTPTNVAANTASSTPFAAQLLQDGVTPVAGADVTLQGASGDVMMTACGLPACSLTTDAHGIISSDVIPLRAGVIPLTASIGPMAATANMTVTGVPDSLVVVAAPPANGALAGTYQFLMVQLVGPDGVNGIAYNDLTWTVISGPFAFTSCVGSSCRIRSDPNGYDAIEGMAWGTGPVILQIGNQQVSLTMQFNATSLPDVLQVVTAPVSGGYTGQTSAVPFAVQTLFNGGTTPVSGKTVTVSVTNGAATLAACAGAASCSLATDANGMISTPVTPLAAGTITLQVNDSGVIASASFTATAAPVDHYAVTGSAATIFVAEGANVQETLSLAATDNGGSVAGQAVHWSSSGGLMLAATDTWTDAVGGSAVTASLGPLMGGAQVSAAGCVWTVYCATFSAVGVAAADQQIVLESGGMQTIPAGAVFAPLRFEVIDSSGNPVVGAAVSVYQTVTALSAGCPTQGRCPAAPVVASNASVMISGSDGTVSISPLIWINSAGGMTQTEVAASVGTQGFVTTVLSQQD